MAGGGGLLFAYQRLALLEEGFMAVCGGSCGQQSSIGFVCIGHRGVVAMVTVASAKTANPKKKLSHSTRMGFLNNELLLYGPSLD